jgi:hypothetical protein
MPHDYFTSLIRTWVPIGIGAVLTFLASRFGIVLDEATGTAAVLACVGIVTALYYAIARVVEARWPALGRILLALGLTRATPEYYTAPR